MTIRDSFITVEEFEAFVNLPENADTLFELIAGEIIEVPSDPYVSQIALIIGAFIITFIKKHKLGHATGEAGGYMVSGERYAPDVAFISYEKQPEIAKSGYNPNPPDLAVEIISDGNTTEQKRLRVKLTNYLAAGTVVWVVDPEEKTVEVHQARIPVKVYREDDTVLGEPVLPEFKLKVADIFG
ncbi:MAG: Uma2 family endonuclease [Chloroflexota bacterium]